MQAGAQTSAVPIPGITEKTTMSTVQKNGLGTPAIASAIPARLP
jgi:hypothetical protein